MDAAYFVRPGPNEELRYSLRSAYVNAGVERVWIVGDPPEWYTGPRIPGNRFGPKKTRNVYDNVRIIAEHPDLPDEVAVWNDDMFPLEPTVVEMAWRCPLAEHVGNRRVVGWWEQSLAVTHDYLTKAGVAQPLSYELHRPLPIVRADMARILADAANVSPGNPPQWRTLYGNLAKAGGKQDIDGKVTGGVATAPLAGVWLSTTDLSFRAVASRLRHQFKARSPWER